MKAYKEISAAATYLKPVLSSKPISQARKPSILTRLSNAPEPNARGDVVRKSLGLLLDIHESLSELDQNSPELLEVLRTSGSRKTVDALLDLISLEGIYPSLLPGVGVPIERRVTSVLHGGVPSKQGDAVQHENVLINVVDSLNIIAKSQGHGLSAALRERTFVDLIAANAQLAYDPTNISLERGRTLMTILDTTPTSLLFPTFISLIHPATPSWLKDKVSTTLSLLPLRDDGIRQAINFIASTDQNQTTKVPTTVLPLEVLARAATVLSAVPQSMTLENWITGIAPQLLDLLDEDHSEMQRAGSYIIGHTILQRRQSGAPGSAGWRFFVEPLIHAILPPGKPSTEAPGSSLVSTTSIDRALHRLAALTTLHPNPGVTKRVITPLLLPLWAVLSLSAQKSRTFSQCLHVLQRYLQTSVGHDGYVRIIDNMLYDGEFACVYAKNQAGELEIRHRSDQDQGNGPLNFVKDLDGRLANFANLLDSAASEEEIGALFAHCVQKWLRGDRRDKSLSIGNESNPVSAVVYAKLTQSMLERYRGAISRSAVQILELIHRILIDFLAMQNDQHSKPSVASLAFMGGNAQTRDTSERFELVAVGLSLISALTASPAFRSQQTAEKALAPIIQTLAQITVLPKLPQSLLLSTTTLSHQLAALNASPIHARPTALIPDHATTDVETYRLAVEDLSAPLPPVRAEGLASITKLITTSSPAISVLPTAILLTSTLQDEDEYVHLAAVKSLAALAHLNQTSVTHYLVDSYLDSEETSGFDKRLRLGEAIRVVVEELGGRMQNANAKRIAMRMLVVSGRRTKRAKEASERAKAEEELQTQKREAEQAWGGEVPEFTNDNEEHISAADEVAARVLINWKGAGAEENLLIRASALSILGVLIEQCLINLGRNVVREALEVVLGVLQVETTKEEAIVRRAAVLVVRSLIIGMERIEETGSSLDWHLDKRIMDHLADVLGTVQAMETDNIVKGHIHVVQHEMNDRKQREMAIALSSQDIRFGLEGTFRGLNVNPELTSANKSRIQELD